MEHHVANSELPPIPAKRYFTIGEVSELCGVKPHVLRYWEQEFPQLKPVKRRGNRRYYQRHDVMLIRQIRSLLYVDGFTISGARNKLVVENDLSDPDQRSGKGFGRQIHPPKTQEAGPETPSRPPYCGRGEKIRTSDPLHPMQVRYQAALRPDARGKL